MNFFTLYLPLHLLFLALKLGDKKKKTMAHISKSLSDEALKDLKRCMKMDKMNGNIQRDICKC